MNVSGLPAGLKFTAKDIIVDAKTKTVTVPANTIYGTPTTASKWNASTGLYTPSTVKITATTAGKTVVNYTVALTVEPLMPWAVGTFDGGSSMAQAQATFTVAANGKISGKYLCGGTNWTISASNFASYDSAGIYVANVTRSIGKVAITEVLSISEGKVTLTDTERPEEVAYFARTDWKNDPWKSIGKAFPKDATLAYGDAEVDKPWAVTLKFKANGAVDVKGEFTTGIDAKDQPVVYLASGSATLIPETEPDEVTGAFEGKVVVYLAPNAKKNFEGYYGEISVVWDGEKFIMQ